MSAVCVGVAPCALQSHNVPIPMPKPRGRGIVDSHRKRTCTSNAKSLEQVYARALARSNTSSVSSTSYSDDSEGVGEEGEDEGSRSPATPPIPKPRRRHGVPLSGLAGKRRAPFFFFDSQHPVQLACAVSIGFPRREPRPYTGLGQLFKSMARRLIVIAFGRDCLTKVRLA